MFKEKWDVIDEYGNPSGRTVYRGDNALKSGEYHLVVHIWILSSDGDFLIQRRSDSKKLMPGEWAATGGAAITGEDSYTAAHRELLEEMGINSSKATMKKLARIKRRNSLVDVWAITDNSKLNELKLQKSEVADAKWVTKDEFTEMITNGNFHNYGKEYFETVFSEIEKFRRASV